MYKHLFPSLQYRLFLFILLLSSCANQPNLEEKSAEELYNTALISLRNKEFIAAAKSFGQVEQYHPYSRLATRAQIMSSY